MGRQRNGHRSTSSFDREPPGGLPKAGIVGEASSGKTALAGSRRLEVDLFLSASSYFDLKKG